MSIHNVKDCILYYYLTYRHPNEASEDHVTLAERTESNGTIHPVIIFDVEHAR